MILTKLVNKKRYFVGIHTEAVNEREKKPFGIWKV